MLFGVKSYIIAKNNCNLATENDSWSKNHNNLKPNIRHMKGRTSKRLIGMALLVLFAASTMAQDRVSKIR